MSLQSPDLLLHPCGETSMRMAKIFFMMKHEKAFPELFLLPSNTATRGAASSPPAGADDHYVPRLRCVSDLLHRPHRPPLHEEVMSP